MTVLESASMPVSLFQTAVAIGLLLFQRVSHAQSQSEKAGTGGVAPAAAGQDGFISTPGLVAGGLLAGAIAVVLAVSSNHGEVAGATTTTTTGQ